MAMRQAETDILKWALTQASGNISLTAERLGISRTFLYGRIRALGISARIPAEPTTPEATDGDHEPI